MDSLEERNSVHEHKWHYQDEKERRQWQDPEAILRRSGLKAGQTLADIGCGDGFFTLPAARMAGPTGLIYASDINSEALKELQRKADAEKLLNIRVREGAAEDLLLCEKCADIVFLGMVLHDFRDPAAVLKQALKTLKPTGRLINLDWEKAAEPIGPPMGIRFDRSLAAQMIEQAGFKVEWVEDSGQYHYLIAAIPFARSGN
jgi:ubiquinone/menaquinone biosynthesis C-methylase UbiE